MFLGQTQKEQIITELKLLQEQKFLKVIKDIQKNGKKANALKFTDVDNQQVAIKVSEDTWIYSQQTKFFYDWNTDNDRDVEEYFTETISLLDYSKEEIEKNVKYFYDSVEALKIECKQTWKQIVCECIFENSADNAS